MLDRDAVPLALQRLPRDWRRLATPVGWMPIAVLVFALAAGISSKLLEA